MTKISITTKGDKYEWNYENVINVIFDNDKLIIREKEGDDVYRKIYKLKDIASFNIE